MTPAGSPPKRLPRNDALNLNNAQVYFQNMMRRLIVIMDYVLQMGIPR